MRGASDVFTGLNTSCCRRRSLSDALPAVHSNGAPRFAERNVYNARWRFIRYGVTGDAATKQFP
jgi:hypothetical protein